VTGSKDGTSGEGSGEEEGNEGAVMDLRVEREEEGKVAGRTRDKGRQWI
jgi:hypothetical protein